MTLAQGQARYEVAGPTLLAATPSEVPPAKRKAANDNKEAIRVWTVIRSKLEQRINALRMWRNSWWYHWGMLARYILPRRFTWWQGTMPTANSMIRGNPINQAILDGTATQAMRICAAGMMNGLCSPSRPWFKFKIGLPEMEPDEETKEFFDTCEDRIYTVMANSNFYDSESQQTEDLVTFGTAPCIIYENEERVIDCYNPAAGEYYLAASNSFRVETLARQFLMTVAQIVEMFGLENCPPDVLGLWKTKGAALETEKIVSHIIEPNFPLSDSDGEDLMLVSADYPWREVYWCWGSGGNQPLSARGFHDQPHVAPRWATMGNDAYGRSPAMDVLPDAMQLQLQTARLAEAIEKLVRPPVMADATLKNQPSSTLPGGVTFVANLGSKDGMRPIYTVEPKVEEMMENMNEVRARIKSGFFNDIFLMLAESKDDETAYEVAKKYEEKLQVLGPIIERQQNENHSLKIKRIFRIMERKGLLPPLPKQLVGVPLGIEYVSIIAIAQRATATAAIERTLQVAGNMAALNPEVMDNIDTDETIRIYGDLTSVKPKMFRSAEAVAQIRANRQKQQQQAAAQQQTLAGVQAAQTLSKTDLGGGMNALSAILPAGAALGAPGKTAA